MMMINNQSLVRNMNKKRVMQQVFNNSAISRSQISKNLNLNKVTVSEIVAESIEQHYFNELGKGASSIKGGRKPRMLEFNSDFGFVMSFDIGYDYIDSLACLINGQMIQFMHHQVGAMDIEERINTIIEEIGHLSDSLKTFHGLMGVAIAIHGIVDDNKVVFTPYVNFKNIDIVSLLEEKFNVPVVIQNEANLSVIYERDFECTSKLDNLVCISLHKGIGVGIILNNMLYTGIHGEAGEVGHSMVYESTKNSQSRKSIVPIERYCSENSIIQKVREKTQLEYLSYTDIKNMYSKGNTVVIDILNEFCSFIAGIIYNLIITLAPEKVFINSNLIDDIPSLMDKIQQRIPYIVSDDVQVELSHNSKYAILLGGVSLIISKILAMSPGELSFSLETSY